MISYKNIEINAWEHNQVQELITQGEGGIKYLYFTLYDNNGVVDLTDATEVIYSATKPDKNAVYNNLEPFDVVFDNTGKVKLKITTGMANIKGVVKGEIQVITPDGVLIFYGIDLKIEKGNGKGVESSNEFTALTKALNKIAILTPEGTVADGAITTEKIANESVTEDKLADGSITTEKIAEDLLKLILGGGGSGSGITYEQVKVLMETKEDTANKVSSFDKLFKDPDKFPTVMAVINYLKDYYYTASEVDGMIPDSVGGVTEEDLAKLKAELSQIEPPTFVSSVSEMTDTNKQYVLDGSIYAYMSSGNGTVANFTNLADPTSEYWKDGYRINSSLAYTEAEYNTCTNLIPFTKGDIIRAVGIRLAVADYSEGGELISGGNGVAYTRFAYSTDGVNIGGTVQFHTACPEAITVVDGVEIIDTSLITMANGTPTHFCLVGVLEETPDDVIITVNEDITYSQTTGHSWKNTGISYTATIYTDLIGIVDENNVIRLSANNLPSGTYTLKYGDDSYETIGTITVE